MKAEFIVNKTGKALKNLALDEDEGQFMCISDMFVGAKVRKILKDAPKDDTLISKFLNRASAAYLDCAQHMQKTLPLNNRVVMSLGCIDPVVRNDSTAVKAHQVD